MARYMIKMDHIKRRSKYCKELKESVVRSILMDGLLIEDSMKKFGVTNKLTIVNWLKLHLVESVHL